MMAVAVACIAGAGALIGSFLNVVIHRLPDGRSLAWPGSRCPDCEHDIAPYDNVPVLSWLILRGRCRHCRQPISARYPIVELLTAVVFGLIAAVCGVDFGLVQQLPFAAALIALAAIDLERRLLPNRILAPLAGFGLIAGAAVMTSELSELLIAGAAAFGAFLVVALIAPGGMGMGDVKLAGVMGLFLGLEIIPALLVAFGAGSVVGLVIVARRGSQARKQAVPFGPFLALGALIGLLAGEQLIELYADRFLR